jgi:cobalamin biosynthesis protein CbiG
LGGAELGIKIMKKLTKATFKKLIRENMNTGMTSFEAMAALQNEFEMYSVLIMDAHTAVLMEDLAASK